MATLSGPIVPQTNPNSSINVTSTSQNTEAQKYFSDEDILKLPLTVGLCGWVKHIDPQTTKILGKEQIKYNVYYAPPDDQREKFVNRMCNEYFVEFAFNTIYPLITRITQSSNMSELQIYNLWRSKLVTIKHAILDDYYVAVYFCEEQGCKKRVDQYHKISTATHEIEKIEVTVDDDKGKKIKRHEYKDVITKTHNVTQIINTFGVNRHFIPDIITNIALYSAITSKAKKGFFIREISETFLTTINSSPNQTMEAFKNNLDQTNKGGIISKAFNSMIGR